MPPGTPVGASGPAVPDPAVVPGPAGVVLPGHPGTVVAVGFSPDGRLLVTADDQDVTLLWSLTDPARPARIAVLAREHATGRRGRGRPLRLPARSIWAGRYRHGRAVAFDPDGRLLATGHGDGVTLLWDLTEPAGPTPAAVLDRRQRRGGEVKAVAFHPDGGLLATGYDDGAVALWDAAGAARPATSPADPTGPDPVACLQSRRFRSWGWRSETFAVAFHPEGRLLATGGFHGGGYRPARIWDVADPTRARRIAAIRPAHRSSLLENPLASVPALAFSPRGQVLVTACDSRAVVSTEHAHTQTGHDSMVILWDVRDPAAPVRVATLTERGGYRTGTRRRRRRLEATMVTGHAGTVRAVALGADGRLLATGGDDRTVLLWDVTEPSRPYPVAAVAAGHPVPALALSPDGRLLATGGGPAARLWRLPPQDSAPRRSEPGPVG